MSSNLELDEFEKRLNMLWLESKQLRKANNIVEDALYFAGWALALAKTQQEKIDNLNHIILNLQKSAQLEKEAAKCQEKKEQ